MAVASGTDDLGDFIHLEADAPNKPGILLRRSPEGPCVVTLYKASPTDPAAVLGLDAAGEASLTLYDSNTAAVLTADSLAKLLGLLNGGITAPIAPVQPTTPPEVPEGPPEGEQMPAHARPAKRGK